MSELRIGIVGLGRRSRLFDHAHQPGGGSRVVAVCETNPERQPVAYERFGQETFVTSDLDALLDQEIDAVGVFTEDFRHAASATRCLEAGVATFVEKPLAISVADCDRILAASRDYGAVLYVGHNMRHMQMTKNMKELIASGEIGEPKAVWCRHFVGNGGDFYFKDWHAERRYVNGLLLQKGVHDIDVIHWLAGARTGRVNAMGALSLYDQVSDRHDGVGPRYEAKQVDFGNWPPLSQRGLSPDLDVEDISQVNLMLSNGVLASYQQCMYTPDNWRNYTVIGTEGRLENFGYPAATIRVWNRRTTYDPGGHKAVEVAAGMGGHGGADPLLIDDFLQVVRGETAPATSPVAARDAVAAGCAATESLRRGGVPLDVAPVEPELAEAFRGRDRLESDQS